MFRVSVEPASDISDAGFFMSIEERCSAKDQEDIGVMRIRVWR